MNSAYQENGEVVQQLTDMRFKEVKRGISDTNRVILQAIKIAEKEDLFVVLYGALSKELNVMFQLKLRCHGVKSKTPECEDGFRGLSHAILNLVDAMYYIADEKWRDAINKAFATFQKYVRERNKTDLGHPYDYGMEVSKVIGSSLGTK
ncbi:hypothetical protein Q1695_003783 [Nippostrongylus brasiliensis]|nr:hypothetical protein Q1695_003783 [Nippostrongylus brasiliensis]